MEWKATPILPNDVEVFRASGQYQCTVCGKIYYEHQKYVYPGYDHGPILGCDGRFYYL